MNKISGNRLHKLFLLIGFSFFFMLNFSTLILSADPLDNWHWRNPLPQGNGLYAITYGNNTFIAVGEAGAILTSADGITWNPSSSGTSNGLWGTA